MAITAQLEDGRLLEFPDGTDPSVIEAAAKRILAQSAAPAAPQEGIGAAFKGGFKRFGSGLETALESIIDPQLAAERGLERGEKISEQYAPGASLERVKQRYEKDGLFSAAKEAVGQIPAALAEQAPNMAAALGGARLGAMAGAPIGGPVGALVGGGVGALAAALPNLYASNLERQAQEGKPVERSTALGAAVPAAALEVVSQYIPLGRNLVGKILGPTAEKALAKGSNEAIEQAAKETLTGSVTRGVGTGLLAEIPTEVTQQMLERLQAGLPITSPDALAEYGEAAYGAGLVGGPFGAIGRLAGRPGARAQYEQLQKEQAALEEPAPPALPSNITELPEGYSVAQEEVGKDYIPSFNIMAPGDENPLATVDTEEEAQSRLQRYTEIRQQEREKINDELEKIDGGVQKMQTKLDYMEATQQTGSEEYQQLKANFPTYMEDAAQKKTDLMDKIEAYGQPLQITPAGQTEKIQEQFNVRDKSGETIQSFKSMGEAEAFVRDTVGEKPFNAAQERSRDMKALEESLTQTMRGFGLKDVAFKLVDQIERNAAGAYGNKLIRVAMDEKNPLQTMRHESVHALKDLGFFTPQQWKALESRAKSEWIKTHLEGAQTEVDGQQMSRLEGYKKIGLTEDAIIEEAIADAFASYDKGQTPPPGLIAQLFKQLKEFFARLKQAMNGAGFQTADDIFQSIERGELKPGLKGAVKAAETKFSKKPSSVQEAIDDGISRLVASARKSRLNTLEERYDVGLSRANSNLDKIENGILSRLKDLGVSTARDAAGNREIDDVFYDKILPAVRSVLKKEERYSLSKPSSDVGHKRVANSGRYVGAPDWVGSSPQQITNLRKKLLKLAKEGEAGKYWYENSSKAILELAGGDKKEAEKIVGLIAIYSPNNTVPGNTSMALNAYYQYKTGQKISAGLSDADKKADELLNQNKPWAGIKTNSFYQNLMVSIDPSKLDQGVATMDMWMALAFDYGMKVLDQGPKYKFAEREIQKIAKDLGWDAHQVQAAIWTAMKGRVEPIRTKLKEAELKNGIGENYDKDGKTLFRVKPDRRYDHYRLAHQMGMEHDLKQEDIIASKYDFSDAIEERTAQMSWEATPGESTGVLPGIFKAPIQQKFEYLEDVGKVLLDANTNDKIAVKIGLPVRKSIVGFSAWNGDIGAGKQTFAGIALEGSKDKRDAKPEARNLLNLYCAIKGYVLNQEAVVWQKPVYDGSIKNQNGIEARFGRGLNFEEMKALYQGLHDKFDTWEIAPGYLDDGFRVLNFTSIPNKEFHKGVQEVLESMPDTFGDGMNNFTAYRSIGDYISNDWSAAKQGEQYAEQIESLAAQVGISNPSDLLKWATGLRTDVEAVNERFSKKYDWGKPTTRPIEPAVRPSTGGGEGITLGNKRQEKAVTVTGVHYGKVQTDLLDAGKYGSGLRGGERRRLDDAFDERIKNRVYFYVKKDTGVMPLRESGIGTHAYTQTFNNILGKGPEMSRLYTEAKGDANEFETKIIDAGYDGYTMPNMGMMVILNHNVPADYRGTVADLKGEHPEAKYSLKTSFATTEAAERAAYKKAPPSTPEFKRFFGASKIMDEGRPQVMYHASPNEFETFSEFKPIFVSPDADKAQSFSALKRLGKGAKRDYIYPLWVRAETPFDYEDSEHVQNVVQEMISKHTNNEMANRIQLGGGLGQSKPDELMSRLQSGQWDWIENGRVQEAIKSLGFDSFYVREGSEKNLAVFKANQVKSVTGNIGDFSLETKDMRYSLKKVRYSDERFKKLWDQSYYTQNDAENKTKGYLAFVNPMEFVHATATFGMYEKLLKEKEPLDAERLKAYPEVPFLSVSEKNGDWKIIGHEGRHRMLALHDAGYREVPVYIHLQADDAKSIPAKALTAQYADSVSSFLMVAEVEPLSYANKDKAMSKFTRMESKVKYSLPNLSAAENDAVNRTTTVRESKGYMERIIDAVSPKNYSYFRQAALNRYEALSVADKIYAKKMGSPGLRASQSAEAAAHMSDLHAGVAASVFGIQGRRGGVPVFKNGMTSVDHSKKGLVEILSPLSKFGDPRAYRDFQFYSGVKRGARLMAQGPQGYTEKLFEPADIKLAESIRLKYEAAGINFEAVRKDWVTFNDSVTDYLVETGVLSKIDAQKFKKYADYIPFYRQLEGERTLGPNIFQSLSGVTKPKALGKGGEAPLADFMETIVRNTHAAITAGMKNAAEQKIINVGKQVGIINDIAPGSTVRAEDRVKVLINGVKHEYQCTDQMFADATRSLNMPDLPFISFLSKPADLLRNMITREPGFIMVNLLRDSVSAYVTSGVNITPISGTVINFAKAIKGNSPIFEAMMDAGIIGGYEFSANAEQSGERLTADLMKKAGKGSTAKRAFDSVWDGLEKATTASDAATRMAVYERVLAETNDETEALYRALEVMNFNRKGSSAVVRILTAAVPFLNARMQGLDVFYRAITGKMNNANAKEIQEKFFRRGMMIMGLSTMYYFAVAGNPEYEKQEQETKDNNWLIPGTIIRIPIPFEVGILFKTIPERIAAYTFGNDTGKDFLDAIKRAANGFIPISPAAYIPQTIKPFIEAATNYSFFTQREIVGAGLKDVAPEFQVGPGTSAFGEFVGKTLGLSPIKVDYLFKGYTGTMGMYAVDLLDMVMDVNSDSPKPTKRFEQLPIIKRLVQDPEARGNVTNYYQLKDSVDTAVRTMNLLEKTGKPEEYAKYVQDNAGLLAMRPYVGDLEKTMKGLRDMKGLVRNSGMTGDQKRDAITEIGQAENNLTANIQTVKLAVEKAKP
jgi:hypothetical protein